MSFLKRRSDDREVWSPKRRSDVVGDSDDDATSESESVSEYEEGRSSLRRLRKGGNSIGRRLVKRRRTGRSEMRSERQVSRRVVHSPWTSPPKGSSEIEDEAIEDASEDSKSPKPSYNALLKWKDIPYPGLPVSENTLFRLPRS
jgi:hypothetical protein